MNPFDVSGRVAIVTGASSGLGERFARLLAGAGAEVYAAARRADRLEQLAASVAGIHPVVCDVSSDTDLEHLVDRALDDHSRVDILVNNAGIGGAYPAESEPLESFRRVMDVNVAALFSLSQIAGRVMLSQENGSIINLASVFGLGAAAPMSHASYCASKGAVVNLTRELAGQWAQRGVRVNAIAPGFFHSELASAALEDEKLGAYIRRRTPMGRPGREDELDGAMLFLASDASSYVTGQTIAVDGGWTIA